MYAKMKTIVLIGMKSKLNTVVNVVLVVFVVFDLLLSGCRRLIVGS